MGIDFAALGTGMEIRQALDVLVTDGTSEEQTMAADTIRERLEELETRLNTARRTAWVAVPIAWSEVAPGDTIVAKDGTLLAVLAVDHATIDPPTTRISVPGRVMESPDQRRPVPVLRRPTADALDILTRQLGAQAM
jgi:hypothetical protein